MPRKQQRQAPTPEVYLSIDVEADGPIPGPYSMLSFGIAAFSIDKVLLSTFTRNLEPLPQRDAASARDGVVAVDAGAARGVRSARARTFSPCASRWPHAMRG